MTPDNPAMLTTKFWDEAKIKGSLGQFAEHVTPAFSSPNSLPLVSIR